MDRRAKLATIKLLHSTVRIGCTPKCGPIYFLAHYDHTREAFTTRNVHTGHEDKLPIADLLSAIADGIAHFSKVPGGVYHA